MRVMSTLKSYNRDTKGTGDEIVATISTPYGNVQCAKCTPSMVLPLAHFPYLIHMTPVFAKYYRNKSLTCWSCKKAIKLKRSQRLDS